MSLTVLDPGLHSLLVDLGRPSSRSLGVPVGGAADRFAFALGNALLGNDPAAVALELLGEIAQPALRDLKVEFRGLRTAGVYPEEMPNLPAGTQTSPFTPSVSSSTTITTFGSAKLTY